MMRIYGDIDDYRINQPTKQVEQVFVFVENEYGFASYVACMSVIGDRQPDGYLIPHQVKMNPFNHTQEFLETGYPYWFVGNCMFVNVNEWPNSQIFPIEEAKDSWVEAYSIVRSLNLFFEDFPSLTHLTMVTSTTLHDALDPKYFPTKEPSEYTLIDITNPSQYNVDDAGYFFAPPTWMIPHFFVLMTRGIGRILVTGHDPTEAIDIEATHTIQQYLYDVFGFEVDTEFTDNLINKINEAKERVSQFDREMEEVMKGRQGNQTMWG